MRVTPTLPTPEIYDLSVAHSRYDDDPFFIPSGGDGHTEYPLSFGVVRVLDREMRKRRRLVLEQLPTIVERYFGYRLQPFHLEMYRRLFRLPTEFTLQYWRSPAGLGGFRWSDFYPGGDESDPDIFQVMLVCTDHGKSVSATEVFPVLSLMHDPDAAHIICCSNATEARNLTDRVRQHLNGSDPKFDQLLHDYPWVGRPAGDRWNMADFTVAGRENRQNRNPSVHATGAGAGDIKGRRGKFIGDDLEGEDSNLLSSREKLYRWASTAAVRCVEDPRDTERPLHCYVGTPFDVDSFYFRLELENFQVFRLPYRYPPKPDQKLGDLIWPQREDKIKALKRRLTTKAFTLQMWLDPSGGDPSALTFEQLHQMARQNPLEPSAQKSEDPEWHYVFCDPAAGSKQRGVDYAGIGMVDIRWPVDDDLPYVTVLEPRAFREGVIDQINLLAELHKKSGRDIVFETNGSQATTYRNLMAAHHPDVFPHLIGVFTSAQRRWDERMGLTVVRTLMLQKRLQVIGRSFIGEDDPEDLEFGRSEVDPDVRQFLNEVRDLQDPNAHNHICAGVWFCIRLAYEQRQTAQFKVVNRLRSPSRAGFGGYAGRRVLHFGEAARPE